MKRIGVVIKYTQICANIILNSPVLKINHKLQSIVVNKGRIQGELMYFLGIL